MGQPKSSSDIIAIFTRTLAIRGEPPGGRQHPPASMRMLSEMHSRVRNSHLHIDRGELRRQ